MSLRNAFVGLAALVLAACGAGSNNPSGCTSDSECKAGRVCDIYTGECVFPSADVLDNDTYLSETRDSASEETYTCQNQCSKVGDKICYDQNTLKECGLDENDCLKWYDTACPEGQGCLEYQCQKLKAGGDPCTKDSDCITNVCIHMEKEILWDAFQFCSKECDLKDPYSCDMNPVTCPENSTSICGVNNCHYECKDYPEIRNVPFCVPFCNN